MEISKENLMKKGNGSLAVTLLFFFSSLGCPCPFCIGSACLAFLNTAREKLSICPKIFGESHHECKAEAKK